MEADVFRKKNALRRLVSAAADLYMVTETQDESPDEAMDAAFALATVIETETVTLADMLQLYKELDRRFPDGFGFLEAGCSDPIDFLKSPLYGFLDDDPVPGLVIKELETRHGINYAEHIRARQTDVQARNVARIAS